MAFSSMGRMVWLCRYLVGANGNENGNMLRRWGLMLLRTLLLCDGTIFPVTWLRGGDELDALAWLQIPSMNIMVK